MKQFSFQPAYLWRLLLLTQLICLGPLSAQKAFPHDHEEEPGHHCLPTVEAGYTDTPPSWLEVENAKPNAAEGLLLSPNVSVVFDQQENSTLLYHPVAAWTGSQASKAQLSLMIWVKNFESAPIFWNKVEYVYVQNNIVKTKTFNLSMAGITPNTWQGWQNGRDYHQVGDVLYLDAPIPTVITVKLYFNGYSTPVVFNKALAPYSQKYAMPFRAFDLAPNEVWEGGSTHGGGSQVFAYDLTVYGFENGVWSPNKSGTNGTENTHARIWGKPIYAMADGVVKSFNNNVPNNPKPGQQANWQAYTNGGAGNHFYIQHGENIALYAHMQKGTLNSALMQNGAVVKAGDFLGYAGNSGSSSGPHLHIHVRKETTVESGPFRPLIFKTGYAISKSAFTSLVSNADWTPLTAHGLPGYAGTRAFIWPSGAKPFYSNMIYDVVYRHGNDGHYLWMGVSAADMITKDNALKNQGYRMTDLSVTKVNNTLQYSGVWRAGSGVSKIQTGVTWAALTQEATALAAQGYRLIDLEVFSDVNGVLKYGGVYGAGAWNYKLVAGLTKANFDTQYNLFKAQGYQLIDVEVYKSAGVLVYAGVFKAGVGNQVLVHGASWANFTDQWEDFSNLGYRLVDMDTYQEGGATTFVGTFQAGNGGYALASSNYNAFMSYWEHVSARGLRLIDFSIRNPSVPSLTADGTTGSQDSGIEAAEEPVGDRAAETPTPTSLEVKVFPNPVADQLTVRSDADILSWTLHSATGQTMLRDAGPVNGRQTTIRLHEMPIGIYQLNVQTTKGMTTQQVQVMR
jgi:hypothetical protein